MLIKANVEIDSSAYNTAYTLRGAPAFRDIAPLGRNVVYAGNDGGHSNCELETQILLSGDLGYIKAEKLKKLQADIGEVERMLKALIKSLGNKHLNPLIMESLNPS